MARPTKLNAQTQSMILAFISAGAPIQVACAAVGINKDTYFHWLKLAGQGRQAYIAFKEAVDKANAQAVVKNVRVVSKSAAAGVWQAAAWWLERRFPDEWARTERHEMTSASTLQLVPAGGRVTSPVFKALLGIHEKKAAGKHQECGQAEGATKLPEEAVPGTVVPKDGKR